MPAEVDGPERGGISVKLPEKALVAGGKDKGRAEGGFSAEDQGNEAE